MPKKPYSLSVGQGYLSPAQVLQRANAMGYSFHLRRFIQTANNGKIRFAEKVPGYKKRSRFPEGNLHSVIADARKTIILTERYTTRARLIRAAAKMGLEITPRMVQRKIERIQNGSEPAIEDLVQDSVSGSRAWLLPKAFVESILGEAKRRKEIAEQLEKGEIIPFTALAEEFGLTKTGLQHTQIKRFTFEAKAYVTIAEATRYRRQRWKRVRGIAANPETEKIARKWTKQNFPYVTSKTKKKLLQTLINRYIVIPPKEFEKLLPVLKRILEN